MLRVYFGLKIQEYIITFNKDKVVHIPENANMSSGHELSCTSEEDSDSNQSDYDLDVSLIYEQIFDDVNEADPTLPHCEFILHENFEKVGTWYTWRAPRITKEKNSRIADRCTIDTWSQEFDEIDLLVIYFSGLAHGSAISFKKVPSISSLCSKFWTWVTLRQICSDTTMYAWEILLEHIHGGKVVPPHQRRGHDWWSLKPDELKAYFDLKLYMGLKLQPNYRSRSKPLLYCPVIIQVMTWDKSYFTYLCNCNTLITLFSTVTRLSGVGNRPCKMLESYLMNACQSVDSVWKTNEIRVKYYHLALLKRND